MRNEKVLLLAEAAITVVLSALFNLVAVNLPINFAGGSISFTMLPIAIFALRRGPGWGALAGAVFGFIDLMMEPYVVHWIQLILDYPLPYLVFGLVTGFFAKPVQKALSQEKSLGKVIGIVIVAILLGVAARYAVHVTSGVVFFSDYAPVGQSALVYSLIYNVTYLAPSMVIVMVLTAVVLPPLFKAVPVKKHVDKIEKPETAAATSTVIR